MKLQKTLRAGSRSTVIRLLLLYIRASVVFA